MNPQTLSTHDVEATHDEVVRELTSIEHDTGIWSGLYLDSVAFEERHNSILSHCQVCSASELIGSKIVNDSITRYILDWARNPDPGSTFERMTGAFRDLEDEQLLKGLIESGYGGMIYHIYGHVVAHRFFQRAGDTLSAFSVFVEENARGQGLYFQMAEDFIAFARTEGCQAVRFGKGTEGPPSVRAGIRYLSSHAINLGISVGDDGLVLLDPERA